MLSPYSLVAKVAELVDEHFMPRRVGLRFLSVAVKAVALLSIFSALGSSAHSFSCLGCSLVAFEKLHHIHHEFPPGCDRPSFTHAAYSQATWYSTLPAKRALRLWLSLLLVVLLVVLVAWWR